MTRVIPTEIKGLFTRREGAPANRATRLEGLTHSPPLHATHLTRTVSGLCAFSFERLLSTTNKSAHQRNFFSSYFSFLHRHGPVLCPRPFYYRCLQNEVLRPKTLSNLGQSNRAKTFPQTPTDRESVGLRFIDQAGSNCKTKTLAQMLFSTSMDTKSMGLPFIDQAGSNYYTWTLAQMLCSMSTDTKSMGLRFVDQAGSNYKTKTRLSLV